MTEKGNSKNDKHKWLIVNVEKCRNVLSIMTQSAQKFVDSLTNIAIAIPNGYPVNLDFSNWTFPSHWLQFLEGFSVGLERHWVNTDKQGEMSENQSDFSKDTRTVAT